MDAAETELLAFAESDLGKRYPATVATWENAWERFIPFLAFPPELRRIIYTTNSIESLNYQLRKIIKNRGHFPNDDAAIKLLWLAIRDIEDKRARQRAKEKGLPPTSAPPPAGWSKAPPCRAGRPPSAPSRWPTPTGSPATSPDRLSSVMAIPSRRAGGVHVERPQRSEDERRGHRQAVEDDQPRRKSYH